MNTLSRNKEFKRFESWEEIISLPGFTENLDPSKHKLGDIIGNYSFEKWYHCGLSSCHTLHQKGFVVTSKDGAVTNIGRICGRSNFGVEFHLLSRNFINSQIDQLHIKTISEFLINERPLSKIQGLLHDGGNEVSRNITSFISRNNGCPDPVFQIISKMIKNRSGKLTKVRQIKKNELERSSSVSNSAKSKPVYQEEVVGSIEGISALFPENNLRKLLILDLKTNCEALERINLENSDRKSLKNLASWCNTFYSKFNDAKTIIASGFTFLNLENLRKFELVLDGKDSSDFKNYLKIYQKSLTK